MDDIPHPEWLDVEVGISLGSIKPILWHKPDTKNGGPKEHPDTKSGGPKEHPDTKSGGPRERPDTKSGGPRERPLNVWIIPCPDLDYNKACSCLQEAFEEMSRDYFLNHHENHLESISLHLHNDSTTSLSVVVHAITEFMKHEPQSIRYLRITRPLAASDIIKVLNSNYYTLDIECVETYSALKAVEVDQHKIGNSVYSRRSDWIRALKFRGSPGAWKAILETRTKFDVLETRFFSEPQHLIAGEEIMGALEYNADHLRELSMNFSGCGKRPKISGGAWVKALAKFKHLLKFTYLGVFKDLNNSNLRTFIQQHKKLTDLGLFSVNYSCEFPFESVILKCPDCKSLRLTGFGVGTNAHDILAERIEYINATTGASTDISTRRIEFSVQCWVAYEHNDEHNEEQFREKKAKKINGGSVADLLKELPNFNQRLFSDQDPEAWK